MHNLIHQNISKYYITITQAKEQTGEITESRSVVQFSSDIRLIEGLERFNDHLMKMIDEILDK
jgi:hypothetical protein